MVEIRYREQLEVAELAGQTVGEARAKFQAEFGIPERAAARLNGDKVRKSAEVDTVLNDDDKLTFAVSRGMGAYLVGAALLALAMTGGVFAYGFINASTTLNATSINSDFADVTANVTGSNNVQWSAFGFFKGSIGGPNDIFEIAPAAGYTGDLVTTVTLANADQLVKRYRVLALKLDMVIQGTNTELDISAGNSANWTLLTMDNGSVSMFTTGASGNMSVRVLSGFYITNIFPAAGWQGAASPQLFCEVAQR